MEQRSHSQPSTPHRTPCASRSYFNAGQAGQRRGAITPALQASGAPLTPSMTPILLRQVSMQNQNKCFIYGTNIDNNSIQLALERFVLEFQVFQECQITHKKYLEDLKNLANEDGVNALEVQALHLKEFDKEMYYQLIYFPAEMISQFDWAIKSLYERMFVEPQTNPAELAKHKLKRDRLMVSIFGLEKVYLLRELTPKDVNRLIMFRGIVIRCSDLHPEMKAAQFSCCNCRWQVQIVLENARVDQPKECPKCKLKNTMEIDHNLSIFTDKQFVKFQQMPEYVPEGQTPNSINIVCYDTGVDQVRPGDRVEVVGIYRAQPVRIQKNRRAVRSIFNTYVDVISSKVIIDNRFTNGFESERTIFDDEQRRRFFEMANQHGIVDRLVASFAPSIFGHQDVKKGILCQLFGGCQKQFSQSGRGRFRSDINVCLVGDPSTAKSQALQQVYKIAPRGIYTSGKGSSAVGLTANVRRDPETNEFILESGALVLSDRGICCIDEFDKMDENSRTILLEAMEQQTISVAKAGIVCSLNSRTAILAAANPVNSRYNPKKSVVENINLTPALLSRFDLIYIMLDKANETYDRSLALHILSIFANRRNDAYSNVPFTRTQLTNYITFARQQYFPQLTQQTCNKLAEAYITMRNLSSDRRTVTATPRQLQSLIRLSQAFAKMRLSTQVLTQDVDNAIGLMKSALQQSATDPRTGLIDMDMIVTGRTSYMRERIKSICHKVREHVDANVAMYRKGVAFETVLGEIAPMIQDERVNQAELKEALAVLVTEGVVDTYGANKNRPSVKVAKDLYRDN